MIQSTDAMGNVAQYTYDANDNPLTARTDGELVDVAGGTGNVRLAEVTYEYDAMNRLTRQVVELFDPQTQNPIGDGQSVAETFYSDNSQVIRVVDDNGHETLTTYDTANRRSVVTDTKGNTATSTYDTNSNVVAVTELEKSDLLNPDQTFTTTYEYDNLDRLIRTIDNVANSNGAGYDSRSNRTVDTDALGNVTRYEYDGLNRLVRTTRFLTDDGTGGGNPVDQIVTTRSWDDNSRLVEQADDSGNSTTYVHDALNRRTSAVFADTTTRSVTYDVHDNQLTVSRCQRQRSGRHLRSAEPADGRNDRSRSRGVERDDIHRLRVRRSVAPGPGRR